MAERETISANEYRSRSRRSFLTGGAAAVGGVLAWRGVQGSTPDHRIPGVLRDVHELNESIWSTLFRENHLATEFPISEASVLRVNGRIGMSDDLDLEAWRLRVLGPDDEVLGVHTIDELRALPHHVSRAGSVVVSIRIRGDQLSQLQRSESGSQTFTVGQNSPHRSSEQG